jgi:hypothetical protein
VTPQDRSARIEEALEYLARKAHDAVQDGWQIDAEWIEKVALAALAVVAEEGATTLLAGPPKCFRCGDAEDPGSLILVGKGNALIPCPYCHPGKAVEWMADAAPTVEPAHPAEPADQPTYRFCNKCGYVGLSKIHASCNYGAYEVPAAPPADSCTMTINHPGCPIKHEPERPADATGPAAPPAEQECPECSGTGKRPVYSAGEEMVADFKPCPMCRGKWSETHAKWKSRALAAEHSLAEAVGVLEATAEALDELTTWQNGPPLITYTEGWTAAMKQASEAEEQARSTLSRLAAKERAK